MLQKGEAQKLLKDPALPGKEFTLLNGDIFLIPNMPLGPSANKLLELMDDMTNAVEGEDELTSARRAFGAAFEIGYRVIKTNYPEITEDECDGLFTVELLKEMIPYIFELKQDEDIPEAGATPEERPTDPGPPEENQEAQPSKSEESSDGSAHTSTQSV